MLDFDDLILKGPAVTLRPLVEADAPALALAAGESREHYAFTSTPDGLDGAVAYVAKALAMRRAGARFPLVTIFEGRIVGSTSFARHQPWEWPAACGRQRSAAPDVVEIGYTWLAGSAQRTRCNSEAKLLMLRHAFEVWDVHCVILRTDERNDRSRRAIERLGARLDGILRADMPAQDCTIRNTAQYSILASEWPSVRENLGTRLAR